MKALFTIWLCLVFSLTAFSQNEYNNFLLDVKKFSNLFDQLRGQPRRFTTGMAQQNFRL